MKRERFGSAKIAVFGIIPEEFDALCAVGTFPSRCPGTNYYVSSLTAKNEYDVVVTRADGWGNLASGEAVTELIEHFKPYFFMLVGIAGGIIRSGERDPIKLGDVLIADYLHYSEIKKLSTDKTLFRYKPHDHPSHLMRLSFAEPLGKESARWIKRIRATPPEACTPRARIGNLVAGETLLGDPKNSYQQIVLDNYYTAEAVDMESMGVGRELFRQRRDPYYNPQFLIVRGISDLVETGVTNPDPAGANPPVGPAKAAPPLSNQQMRDAWRVYAAEAAAAFALTLIDDLLVYISTNVLAPVGP